MTGYLHPAYLQSLREFGQPIALPDSKGWLLKRRINSSADNDAMGCYPLFLCEEWERLADDIRSLESSLVSVALVADPFGNHSKELLDRSFDSARHFKSHFVVELGPPLEKIVSKHHCYYAKKALEINHVEVVLDPRALLPDWCRLYNNLISRHGLHGISAFSPASFDRQFEVDGLVVFQALYQGRIVGMHLWMVNGTVANSHLAAFSNEGYECLCAYALYWEAIRHFTGKVAWLNLGAGAGWNPDASDGLTQFKRGWATGTRPAFFCSSILQPEKYKNLCEDRCISKTSYFPAYRSGEFEERTDAEIEGKP